MDLSNVHYKGMELVEFLTYSMGDPKNKAQYKSLILDELEKQNVSVEDFDVTALRQFSVRILERSMPEVLQK